MPFLGINRCANQRRGDKWDGCVSLSECGIYGRNSKILLCGFAEWAKTQTGGFKNDIGTAKTTVGRREDNTGAI